jgi:type I restriction enzyme S subunit
MENDSTNMNINDNSRISLILNDVCEFIVDCEHKTAPTQESGYPSIRTPNVGKGRLLLEGVNRVSEETYTAWTQRAVPQAHDLILAREAPVGNVAIVPEHTKLCLGQRTVLIRPNPNLAHSQYLVYYLLGPEVQGRIHSLTAGATVAHLNMSDIRGFPLTGIHPLPIQKKIAAILSAYDDLIENNERRIKILEEIAQNLYREWFLNFRFPGHENVKLVDSPLGKIPEGWKVVKVRDVADVNSTSIRNGNAPEHIVYVDIKSVSTGSIDTFRPMSFADAPSRARRTVQHGDTLWSSVRPNRRSYSLLLHPSDNLVVSTGFGVLRPTRVPYTFFYFATTTDAFADYLANRAKGAAYPAVGADDFEDADLLLGSGDMLAVFHETVEPMVLIRESLRKRNQSLRQARDLLMPKLISGQLDVSEIDITGAAYGN